MRVAAFDTPYAAMLAMPSIQMDVRFPAAELMMTIVFLSDVQRRGRNAVMLWTRPRVFTLNYRSKDGCEV